MSRERPILFSAPMVRALLAGTKTQTRRVVKHPDRVESTPEAVAAGHPPFVHSLSCPGYCDYGCGEMPHPYGAPGDRLWVKETWRPTISHGHGMDACDCGDVNVSYLADGASRFFEDRQMPDGWTMPKAAKRGNVTPLFMPRWASRITLEVTGVRVERLQDISEADAKAEGLERFDVKTLGVGGLTTTWRDYLGPSDPFEWYSDPRRSFRSLWERINGDESWAANPWVWCVYFRRLSADEKAGGASTPRAEGGR